MNILDESIIESQREELQAWRIHFRAIGRDVGSFGMKDINEILPLLHSLARPTFFTMDDDFYHPTLRHAEYCLACLDVYPDEAAKYIRRFLRHRTFRTQSQRMGSVVRIRHAGIGCWQVGALNSLDFIW